MNILHIASIGDEQTCGVNVVVPQHVNAQGQYENTALVNINNKIIKSCQRQITYHGIEGFPQNLDKPFNKPDIVVFHESNIFEYVKMYKELVRLNIPYIIIPHGELTKQALKKKWLKKKIAYILWFNKFVKKALALQCLSEGEKNNIKYKKNAIVIPNGVYVPEIYKNKYSENAMRLLYIGRLETKIKGLDLMIEAIGEISTFARDKQISLDIFGPDVLGRKQEVEKYIELYDVGDIVKIHNSVFGKEKEARYLDHDVFIQTSRTEGLPLGVLETMSIGMPIILTKGTRLMDEVDMCNGGYPAGTSVDDIVKAIKKAYMDKENWSKKGNNAREYILNKYSWQIVSRNTIENYKELVKRG